MYPITSTAAFPASYKNLAEIGAFVSKAAELAGLNEGAIYAVQRAVDEACSNIIEHAYKGKKDGKIECLCIACENGLIVRFQDNGKPFDPSKIPSPVLHTDLEKRPVGGLGLYFMHRLMDEVNFEFSPSSVGNTVTMVKYNDRYFQTDIWPQIIALAEKLTRFSTLQEQCTYIREVAMQLFRGQVLLWLVPSWVKESASSVCDEFPPEPHTELMVRAYQTKSRVYPGISIPPLSGYPSTHENGIHKNYDLIENSIAVPLIAHDEVIGVVQVDREDLVYTRAEAIALEGLASQAAMALSATRQAEVARWRIEQLSLVRSVSAQIANVVDLDELTRQVTRLILDTFNYYYTAIFTLQPGADFLNFCASSGPLKQDHETRDDEPPTVNVPLHVHIGDGLIGIVASTGVEILANDVRRDPRYQFHDSLPETLAEVALPLKIGFKILGVLDVQSNILEDFDESDMLVLRALADNIAIAVEGIHLYTALRRRADQLSTVSEISNAITSILNHDDLLIEVIRLIRERFGYPFVQIYTVNAALGDITYAAGSSPNNTDLCADGLCFRIDDSTGLIPYTARTATTTISNDVNKEPLYRPSGNFPGAINSELVVPLVFGGEVHGILDVQSDKVGAFTDEDRSLFEALADNIATAMRNAQLYRSEAWRRQVADSLHAVAGLLSADVSLSQLLDSILTELERALPCDAAAIWLTESKAVDEELTLPRFQLAAIHSNDGKLLPETIEKSLDVIVDGRTWLAKALQATTPLIRSQGASADISEPKDPFSTLLGFTGNYSLIAAPLRVGTTSLGVLTLAHHSPGRYGNESQAMTATFASYAAVAIENARLYESAHDQAWVSTVLLQVAEATQSLTDIDELLATVVQITPLLVGVNACALMMWDDDEEAFIPGAAEGLTAKQQEVFDQWVVLPGEEPAFDQLREVKTPVLLANWSFPKPENDETIPEDEKQGARPLVLFPMVVQDTVLGGLLVDFAGTEYRGDADFDNEEFLRDEKLAVIQGIAHQTAIAVENIRLLKAQKEEAYVSVALLQVAQAVVSLIDLHEILETIVRIAPILVGVNRCVIYLWDEVRVGFWLAQSYGLPREVEDYLTTRLFTTGEFPLLDVVYEKNRMAHIVLETAPSQPTEWEQMVPEDLEYPTNEEPVSEEDGNVSSKGDLAVTEKGFTEEILKHFGCLLYAFPLSVKGTVLGVLLAEEAPTPADVQSFHVRVRRLEIITGITQQAALAIQNDRLQNEMVERERLESEMQLARSIQRTFLPQHLPTIPNWDLDTRWRTARQVGGDFYDLIELPNNRLGLVIADVADKGMPAALFMTLVRTLIRAAVQEEESPASVLEEVNDLMIPDTQNGMFVTVIYAILNLDTGQMIYANAGHNLPLLLKTSNQEVSPLQKGGIALGILKDIHLEDHEVLIGSGECVIFYTDGVTESFSPDDEMYGEERLMQTLRAACCDSASTMLDAIDNSINEFTGDVPRADDLTMVAIRRLSA